jgi:hypothetical protein
MHVDHYPHRCECLVRHEHSNVPHCMRYLPRTTLSACRGALLPFAQQTDTHRDAHTVTQLSNAHRKTVSIYQSDILPSTPHLPPGPHQFPFPSHPPNDSFWIPPVPTAMYPLPMGCAPRNLPQSPSAMTRRNGLVLAAGPQGSKNGQGKESGGHHHDRERECLGVRVSSDHI